MPKGRKKQGHRGRPKKVTEKNTYQGLTWQETGQKLRGDRDKDLGLFE